MTGRGSLGKHQYPPPPLSGNQIKEESRKNQPSNGQEYNNMYREFMLERLRDENNGS